jgi:serine protease Do
MTELPRIVAMTPPGTEAEVKVMRQGQEQRVQVKVGEMPQEQRQAAVEGGAPEERLGLIVQELTPELARRLEVPNARGVVVTDVEEGSPADEVGIRPGDVILEVNQQKITGLEDYRAAVQRTGDAESVLLLVRREGSALYVVVQPEG